MMPLSLAHPLEKCVVFGATGPVGTALLVELRKRTDAKSITAVSRSAKTSTDPRLAWCQADCLQVDDVLRAATGATTIFTCIGLEYKAAVWRRDFPAIVQNLLAATRANPGSVLVFLDNLYCFGPEALISGRVLRESDTEFTHVGGKPGVRAALDIVLLNAMQEQDVNVAIVRASDFFGPNTKVSVLGSYVFPAMLKGQQPTVTGPTGFRHSLTYVPDIATAMVAVAAGGDRAWNRAWHVPCGEARTMQAELEHVAQIIAEHRDAGKGSGAVAKRALVKASVLPSGVIGAVVGVFVPVLKEVAEMRYQFEHDFVVDSKDFESTFPDLELPTDRDAALRETVAWWVKPQ